MNGTHRVNFNIEVEFIDLRAQEAFKVSFGHGLFLFAEFPTLTQTLILKDTWTVIVQQMHTLGLSAFTKLFRLNANFKYVILLCPLEIVLT